MKIASRPVPTIVTVNDEGVRASSMTVPVLSELTLAAHVTVVVPNPVKSTPPRH